MFAEQGLVQERHLAEVGSPIGLVVELDYKLELVVAFALIPGLGMDLLVLSEAYYSQE